jgi:uncharacterized protein (TIGR00369 family)
VVSDGDDSKGSTVTDGNTRTWETLQDALLGLWTQMTGAEILHEIAEGRIPAQPYYREVGLKVEGAEPGKARLTWHPTAAVCHPEGAVQGGYIALVLDEVCGCAASTLGDRVFPMITLNLNIDYLRAIRPGQAYHVTGEVVHPGKRRIVANSHIHNAEGALVAQATAALVPDLSFAEHVRQFNEAHAES